MKKILIVLLAGTFCIFQSCADKSKESAAGLSEKAQKNLEASREIGKAFNTGDISMIDSVVASDFVDHTPDRGDLGRDSLKEMITQLRKAFPDMKTEVSKEWADDDYVYTHMRITGTSNGDMGMPVGPYEMNAIQVAKFRDGKAVEHWEYMLMNDMMKMMAPPPPPRDTTKVK